MPLFSPLLADYGRYAGLVLTGIRGCFESNGWQINLSTHIKGLTKGLTTACA